MVDFNIGELARQIGIQPSAIRYYEEIGLMPSPPRIGGWRRYEASLVDRLQVIHTAREMGFSIEEIRTLLDGFPQATVHQNGGATLRNRNCLRSRQSSPVLPP
jgi:MerR family transcriptional regulator, redox-sensitive transcriptional activator SoxR